MEEMSTVMWAVIVAGQGFWIFAAAYCSLALDAQAKLEASPDISPREVELMERTANRARRKALVASVLAFVIAQLSAGVLYFAPWSELLNYAFCFLGLFVSAEATIKNYTLYRNITRFALWNAQRKRKQRGRQEADELLKKSELREQEALNG